MSQPWQLPPTHYSHQNQLPFPPPLDQQQHLQPPSNGAWQPDSHATGLSNEDFAWLEQQLSFSSAPPPAAAQEAPPPPSNGVGESPHAFPPVSNARFHPYQHASERAGRKAGAGGLGAAQTTTQTHLSVLPSHLLPPSLQQQPPPLRYPPRPPLAPSTSSTGSPPTHDAFGWPSFGSVASSFAPVSAPPPHSQPPPPPTFSHQYATPPLPTPPQFYQHQQPQQPQHQQKPTVLYPPFDAPSPILLPEELSPFPLPPAPNCSPASVVSVATPQAFPLQPYSNSSPRAPRSRRRRATSAPPPSLPLLFPPVTPATAQRSVPFAGSSPSPEKRDAGRTRLELRLAREERRQQQLSTLFQWLDTQRWSFSHLFTALSDVDPSSASSVSSLSHRRRLEEFLMMGNEEEEAARRLREVRSRFEERERDGGEEEGEKGPDEVVRMWEEMGGLGRKRGEGNMANAVRELHSHLHDGDVAGISIRNIINRYGEAYSESASDMKRLDAALQRPPSPHLSSAPREAAVWTGVLVIPPMQADVLQSYLTAEGRPSVVGEKGKIEAEHMRIYSSLSPLDLHARGAELCRIVLLRDADAMRLHGHNFDRLHTFSLGPLLAPLDTCGFSQFDDYSLFHHAVMVYLQLCVRYPQFRESKDATITIHPDLPPPLHLTPLETRLVDNALKEHWEHLRLFLLETHGGLLRSAVRAFTGVKLSKVDLLSVCDDTKAVMIWLVKNKKNPNDRILPYDPSISVVRNQWRNTAFYDPTAELVVWSAATTHFLELSALFPEFGLGVRDLPGLESLLSQQRRESTTTSPTPGAMQGISPHNGVQNGVSPMSH